MVPLTSLNPKWIGLIRPDSGEGVSFDCPVCGPSHSLIAYFTNPLDGLPAVGWKHQQLWSREGDAFENLSLEPSIQHTCFHGWVENGQVISTGEATHQAHLMDRTGKSVIVALSPRQVATLRAQGKIQ